MKYELLMECRAGTRHAFRTHMIIKLPNGNFKLHKICSQCKSEKFPTWAANGRILGHGTYKHSKEYREFLDDHDPIGARAAILGSDIPRVQAPTKEIKHGTKDTSLRLVHGRRQKARDRKPKSVKRSRDKKHTAS